jgi:hypothetical protein
MKDLLLCLFLFSFFCASGQLIDSADKRGPVISDSAVNIYFASQSETLAIHNGRVFYGYPGVLGDAFFPETGWQKGSILFDGTWYHDIFLRFDIYKDEVVVLHPNTTPVRIISERVQQFYFHGQDFVRLNPDNDNIIKSGFYQRLTNGAVTIFARRHKKIEENIVELAIERKFVSSSQYYVLKDGIYHVINKQKSLLDLLKDSRQNIVQHLNQQKLRYKNNKEKTIIEIAKFYNQSHQ